MKNIILIHSLEFASYFLGFFGTWIIYKFGVPNQIDTGGRVTLVLCQVNEEEKKRIKLYKRNSALGLGMIASSFLLQLIGKLLIMY